MYLKAGMISCIIDREEMLKSRRFYKQRRVQRRKIMFGFTAYFYKNHAMIEGAGQYKTNEILTAYLEYDFPDLKQTLDKCKEYERRLHYPERGDENLEFDDVIQRAFIFYDRLDAIIEELPPYNKLQVSRNRLYNIVNEHNTLFDNDEEDHDSNYYPPDFYDHFYTPDFYDDLDADMYDNALQLNRKLAEITRDYRIFVEDCIRVKKVYADFLEMLHKENEYLNSKETADLYRYYLTEQEGRLITYMKLEPSGTMSETFVPLKLDDDYIMCEKYKFSTIGGFLYIDLFKGLQNHFLPRKCNLCGMYFLLEATAYSAFCTRRIKGERKKTCRDLGSRKTYMDKVNSDPILLTYTKAYKQHYARYLKKKMTQSEFREWADHALLLRQKAYNKEMSFEEYEKNIRL